MEIKMALRESLADYISNWVKKPEKEIFCLDISDHSYTDLTNKTHYKYFFTISIKRRGFLSFLPNKFLLGFKITKALTAPIHYHLEEFGEAGFNIIIQELLAHGITWGNVYKYLSEDSGY